jgi:saccharopine dehydrogenase-like NADP-dependent oxidoreductase
MTTHFARPIPVALLGAGHIGQTIAELLLTSNDYRVTVFDRSEAALAALHASLAALLSPEQAQRLSTQLLKGDAHNTLDSLEQALLGQRIVINALPYHLATRAAQAAREAGCHYFDLTEDVAATEAIAKLAKDAPTAFMPQCGLAPGFIGVVAHHLASQFETVHSVKMRVGALPAFPTNALKYNLTWSVDGLINEYCHPCEAVHDGQLQRLLPLEGLEHFSLDGVEYEAFNTSGGLGTLAQTWAGRARSLDYKSVRYPGHRDLMVFLLEELALRHDTETLKTIMRRSVPTTMQDVVLVFVMVAGERGGQLVQEVFTRKIFADRHSAKPKSAIQITTAAGICAAVDLFCEGKLPQSGFIRQEQIALPDFLANRFGHAYEEFRAIETIA